MKHEYWPIPLCITVLCMVGLMIQTLHGLAYGYPPGLLALMTGVLAIICVVVAALLYLKDPRV